MDAILIGCDGGRFTLPVRRDGDAHVVTLPELGVYGVVVLTAEPTGGPT
jgi:hypothetical protein